MKKRLQTTQHLDRHAEAIRTGDIEELTRLEHQAAYDDDLAPLMALARLLWASLQPVQPRTAFRMELNNSLQAELERKRVQEALGIEQRRTPVRPPWLVPIAAIGTASIVGAFAYWRLTRQLAEEEPALAA